MNDPVTDFTLLARQYCTLLEGEDIRNSWEFAEACLRSVLRLYDGALRLPNAEPTTSDRLARVEHAEWERMRIRISGRLYRDYYWQIFEPLETDPPEAVMGSLSDDLADIWRDLQVGLRALDKGLPDNTEVVWDWRFSFETHWAHHAAGAVTGLTALCFGQFADSNRA